MNNKYCKLRGALYELGFTQREIAKALLITEASVSQRMTGTIPWRLDEMYKVMDLLSIPYECMHDYFPSPLTQCRTLKPTK